MSATAVYSRRKKRKLSTEFASPIRRDSMTSSLSGIFSSPSSPAPSLSSSSSSSSPSSSSPSSPPSASPSSDAAESPPSQSPVSSHITVRRKSHERVQSFIRIIEDKKVKLNEEKSSGQRKNVIALRASSLPFRLSSATSLRSSSSSHSSESVSTNDTGRLLGSSKIAVPVSANAARNNPYFQRQARRRLQALRPQHEQSRNIVFRIAHRQLTGGGPPHQRRARAQRMRHCEIQAQRAEASSVAAGSVFAPFLLTRPFMAAIPRSLQFSVSHVFFNNVYRNEDHVLLGFSRHGRLLLSYRTVEFVESDELLRRPARRPLSAADALSLRPSSFRYELHFWLFSLHAPVEHVCSLPLFTGPASALLTVTETPCFSFIVHGESTQDEDASRARHVSLIPSPLLRDGSLTGSIESVTFAYHSQPPYPAYDPRLHYCSEDARTHLILNTGSRIIYLSFALLACDGCADDTTSLEEEASISSRPAAVAAPLALNTTVAASMLYNFPDNSLLEMDRKPASTKELFLSSRLGQGGSEPVAESALLSKAFFSLLSVSVSVDSSFECFSSSTLTDANASSCLASSGRQSSVRISSPLQLPAPTPDDMVSLHNEEPEDPFAMRQRPVANASLPVQAHRRLSPHELSVEKLLMALKGAVPKLSGAQLIDYDLRVCGRLSAQELLLVVFAQFADRRRKSSAVGQRREVIQVGSLLSAPLPSAGRLRGRAARVIQIIHVQQFIEGAQRAFTLNRQALESAQKFRAQLRSAPRLKAEHLPHVLTNQAVLLAQSKTHIINPLYACAIVDDERFKRNNAFAATRAEEAEAMNEDESQSVGRFASSGSYS